MVLADGGQESIARLPNPAVVASVPGGLYAAGGGRQTADITHLPVAWPFRTVTPQGTCGELSITHTHISET